MAFSRQSWKRELSEALGKEGFEFDRYNASGHLVFRHPRVVTHLVAGSSGDPRAIRNSVAQARRLKRGVSVARAAPQPPPRKEEPTMPPKEVQLSSHQKHEAYVLLKECIDKQLPILRYTSKVDPPQQYQWYKGWASSVNSTVQAAIAQWLLQCGYIEEGMTDPDTPRKVFFLPNAAGKRWVDSHNQPEPKKEEPQQVAVVAAQRPAEPAKPSPPTTGWIGSEEPPETEPEAEEAAAAPVPEPTFEEATHQLQRMVGITERDQRILKVLSRFSDEAVDTILQYGVMAYQDDIRKKQEKLQREIEEAQAALKATEEILRS